MTYLRDKERNKFVVQLEKSDLTEELKADLKKVCLWTPSLKAWVSRCFLNGDTKHNFLKVMKKYHIPETQENNLISVDEQINHKIEYFEKSIENMQNKADNLQEEFNKHRGNHAFMFQSSIDTSAGKRFENYRKKTTKRYEKGIELKIKSNEKAEKLEEFKRRKKNDITQYYTMKEIAELLGVTYQTVQLRYSKDESMGWEIVEDKRGKMRKVIKKEIFDKYLMNRKNNKK